MKASRYQFPSTTRISKRKRALGSLVVFVWLVELMNSPANDAVRLGFERETADDLLSSSRLYRQTAQHTGNVYLAAMLEDLNSGLTQLLDEVDRLGIAGSTYIVFTADNGGNYTYRGTDPSLPLNNHPLRMGKQVFGSVEAFYDWIHSNPPMLDGDLSFLSLTSYDGIQKVLTQIGRIEHGILA